MITKLPGGELTLKQIADNDLKIMSIKDFRDEYHPNAPVETISYWVAKEYIHYFRPGRERFIVLSKKTLSKKVNTYNKE